MTVLLSYILFLVFPAVRQLGEQVDNGVGDVLFNIDDLMVGDGFPARNMFYNHLSQISCSTLVSTDDDSMLDLSMCDNLYPEHTGQGKKIYYFWMLYYAN